MISLASVAQTAIWPLPAKVDSALESLILELLHPADHARTLLLHDIIRGIVRSGGEQQVFHDPLGRFFCCLGLVDLWLVSARNCMCRQLGVGVN